MFLKKGIEIEESRGDNIIVVMVTPTTTKQQQMPSSYSSNTITRFMRLVLLSIILTLCDYYYSQPFIISGDDDNNDVIVPQSRLLDTPSSSSSSHGDKQQQQQRRHRRKLQNHNRYRTTTTDDDDDDNNPDALHRHNNSPQEKTAQDAPSLPSCEPTKDGLFGSSTTISTYSKIDVRFDYELVLVSKLAWLGLRMSILPSMERAVGRSVFFTLSPSCERRRLRREEREWHRRLKMVAVDTKPNDVISDEKCQSTNDNSACYVINGGLSIYHDTTISPTTKQSITQMYSDIIKQKIDAGYFNSGIHKSIKGVSNHVVPPVPAFVRPSATTAAKTRVEDGTEIVAVSEDPAATSMSMNLFIIVICAASVGFILATSVIAFFVKTAVDENKGAMKHDGSFPVRNDLDYPNDDDRLFSVNNLPKKSSSRSSSSSSSSISSDATPRAGNRDHGSKSSSRRNTSPSLMTPAVLLPSGAISSNEGDDTPAFVSYSNDSFSSSKLH